MPRELTRMLKDGRLTPAALLLVVFLGGESDPVGDLYTTIGLLRDTLGLSDKTIRRSLHRLRALDLIAYDDHAGQESFRVSVAPVERRLVTGPVTEDVTEAATGREPMSKRIPGPAAEDVTEPVTEPVTEVTSDTPPRGRRRKPASENGKPAAATSDTSRARAETETETREPTARAERAPAQKLVAYYVDLLKATGSPAPRRLVGQVAQQVGELVDEGIDEPIVRRALERLVKKPTLGPAALPSLIPEAAADLGRQHNQGSPSPAPTPDDAPPVDPEAAEKLRQLVREIGEEHEP